MIGLDKMKITYNATKSYLQRTVWKCSSQIFILYLKFIAPDSVSITLNSKQFMYRTYFVEFKFRWHLERFLFSFIFSVFPELT